MVLMPKVEVKASAGGMYIKYNIMYASTRMLVASSCHELNKFKYLTTQNNLFDYEKIIFFSSLERVVGAINDDGTKRDNQPDQRQHDCGSGWW